MNDKDCYNQQTACDVQASQPIGKVTETYYRPSALAEAEKAASYHSAEARKKTAGAVFLRDQPAFNEFIRLVRQGSIEF